MTSDTDALFSEASNELQEDVRENLTAAEDAMPDTDDVWELDDGNVIGVLNQLQSALKTEDIEESFQEARKWYVMGEKAEAFDEDEQEQFEERFEQVEAALESMADVRDGIDDLIPKVPEVKGALEDLESTSNNDSEADVDEDTAGDDDSSEDNTVEDEATEDKSNTDAEKEDGDSDGAAESWDGSSDDSGSADDQSSLA